MKGQKLTERQQQVLDIIREHLKVRGVPPSRPELARALGVHPPSRKGSKVRWTATSMPFPTKGISSSCCPESSAGSGYCVKAPLSTSPRNSPKSPPATPSSPRSASPPG